MSTRKSKDESAEQVPPPKGHSLSQVKEVALMLYARRPFPPSGSTSEWEWDSLVLQALDVLDNLDRACARVGESRRKAGARNRNAEKKLPLNASGNVLYNAAVKFITDQEKPRRALSRFETVVLANARDFGATTARQARAKLAHWRKYGMTRDEVLWQHALWNEKAYRYYREATAAKKRAPWSDVRREKNRIRPRKARPPGLTL